jgi:hypothetical protein
MTELRFSPRQLRFLEFYFSGHLMKDAARAAGYKGQSDQALCNRGRKILNKLNKNPKALFRRAGPRGLRVSRLIADTLDNAKPARQLAALKILTRVYFP